MSKYIKAVQTWHGMNARCYRKTTINYENYGGRGIYIDEKWLTDPDSFVIWYVDKYFEGCQIDRTDNDGPYSEENCNLVHPKINNRNRRNTVMITAWNETKPCGEWAEDERAFDGCKSSIIRSRIQTGYTPELAISTPLPKIKGQQYYTPKFTLNGQEKTLLEWSQDDICVVEYKTAHSRIHKRKWDLERALTEPADSKGTKMINGIKVNDLLKRPDCVVGYGTLQDRLEKGWDVEAAVTTPGRGTATLYEGKTLAEWSRDSSCEVKLGTLRARIDRGGWPLEKALKK